MGKKDLEVKTPKLRSFGLLTYGEGQADTKIAKPEIYTLGHIFQRLDILNPEPSTSRIT